MKRFILLFFCLFLLAESGLFAQHYQSWVWFKRKRYYSFGAGINAMNYFGDITPKPGFVSTDIEFTRPNFSVYAQRRLFPGFTARLSLSYGQISAYDTLSAKPRSQHDQFRYVRNLNFKSNIFELSAVGMFDLVKNRSVFYQRPDRVVPYLVAGIGVFYHNPTTIAPAEDQLGESTGMGGKRVPLRKYKTENQSRAYSPIQLAIPLGFGLRYKIGTRWDVSFEVAYRYLLTDYLDDVSKNYVDLNVFGDGETANLRRALHDRSREDGRNLSGVIRDSHILRLSSYYFSVPGKDYPVYEGYGNPQWGNIRGNSKDNDVYIVTGFHVSYIIPGQVRCPEPFKKKFRRHRL